MLVAFAPVCLCVCLFIIKKNCPLASVASFGDIAIIFSQQLGIVALRRWLVLGENPSKNIDAIRYRKVILKATAEVIIIYRQCRF